MFDIHALISEAPAYLAVPLVIALIIFFTVVFVGILSALADLVDIIAKNASEKKALRIAQTK